MGVKTRIFKIQDRLSIEIVKTKFQKGVFFATPFMNDIHYLKGDQKMTHLKIFDINVLIYKL